jgi:uroporphyrinogen decarboxylase
MLGDKTLDDLKMLDASSGRIPIVLDALKVMREQHQDKAIYGLITGSYTLALHLLGTDIFMEMYDNPDRVKKIISFCNDIAKEMSSIYLKNGCDIIAVVDPMTSQIGPDQFEEFCSEPSIELFDHIRAEGGKGSFFVCGHAKNNIEVMCNTKPDNISIDENIPLDYVKEICMSKNVSFGGNMKLTTVMLLGSPEANQFEAVECMEIGGNKGFILAPGCDMPYAVAPENAIAIAEVVHDEYKREIAKELASKVGDAVEVEKMDMSIYKNSDKVIIDIVTLDSEGCPPCQYMVAAVKAAVDELDNDSIEWREHKIKKPESITFMQGLGVKNIPTTCIDGEIAFVSLIPRKEALIEAIMEKVNAKKAKS